MGDIDDISLSEEHRAFVREMLDSGEYATASEAVRDGLRLLRRRRYAPLVQRWLLEGPSEELERELPADVREDIAESIKRMCDEAIDDVRAGNFVDGDEAMARARAYIEKMKQAERQERRSA